MEHLLCSCLGPNRFVLCRLKFLFLTRLCVSPGQDHTCSVQCFISGPGGCLAWSRISVGELRKRNAYMHEWRNGCKALQGPEFQEALWADWWPGLW